MVLGLGNTMGKKRYKFTGVVDNVGDLVARDNGTRRIIDSVDIRRFLQANYKAGDKLTLEVEFDTTPMYNTFYADNYVALENIVGLKVMTEVGGFGMYHAQI